MHGGMKNVKDGKNLGFDYPAKLPQCRLIKMKEELVVCTKCNYKFIAFRGTIKQFRFQCSKCGNVNLKNEVLFLPVGE